MVNLWIFLISVYFCCTHAKDVELEKLTEMIQTLTDRVNSQALENADLRTRLSESENEIRDITKRLIKLENLTPKTETMGCPQEILPQEASAFQDSDRTNIEKRNVQEGKHVFQSVSQRGNIKY
jgi:predicted  nucleic acid-binding Zn-ribbon protein